MWTAKVALHLMYPPFRHGTQFLGGKYYHACCVDVFVAEANACAAAWVVHVSKILVT